MGFSSNCKLCYGYSRIFLGDGNELLSKEGCYHKWCWGIVITLKKLTKKPWPTLPGRNRQFGKLYKTESGRKPGSIGGDQAKPVLQVLGFAFVRRPVFS